ncbi:glucuronoxylan 4-O-methyltransferase 1 [Physcomitrium patens]|nr:glucuronoxylan 4-O-methyltransferase 1-like [Physcomitrium patens]|eukprot:XP_024397766.1 glucuronoxylan 4-O-methyltransferase 1-like [Physcomitrella patens]
MKMAKGTVLQSAQGSKKGNSTLFVIAPLLFSVGLLAVFFGLATWNPAAKELIWAEELGGERDRRPQVNDHERERGGGGAMPHDVALALLHFATTKELPQQSKDEIAMTLGVLLQRAPCNFLVFGMWYDSLLWATFNYGGRTVFLDESQEWIDRMRVKHPELEIYKVKYSTTLQDASDLLQKARETISTKCRPYQPIETSECALAMSQLPIEILSVQWDVIMIDGPRSYPKYSNFPGRMSPIFTSAVVAHTRTASEYTDIFLHDVSRPLEKQFSEEFLCATNLVKSIGDLWHFQVYPGRKTRFCSDKTH